MKCGVGTIGSGVSTTESGVSTPNLAQDWFGETLTRKIPEVEVAAAKKSV